MTVPKQPLKNLLAAADPKAVDLLEKLLVLNPLKRLTAEQALEHPYVIAFHKPEREPALDHDVVPTLSDAIQLSVDEYRNKLYEVIAQQKRHQFHRLSLKYSREIIDQQTDTPTNEKNELQPKTKVSLVKSSTESRNITADLIPSAGVGSSLRKRSTSSQNLSQRSNETALTSPAPSVAVKPGRKLVTRHSDNWSSAQIRNKEVHGSRTSIDAILRKSSLEANPARIGQGTTTTSTTTTYHLTRSHSGHPLVTNNSASQNPQSVGAQSEVKGETWSSITSLLAHNIFQYLIRFCWKTYSFQPVLFMT